MILALVVQGRNLSLVTELNTLISGRRSHLRLLNTEAGIADEF